MSAGASLAPRLPIATLIARQDAATVRPRAVPAFMLPTISFQVAGIADGMLEASCVVRIYDEDGAHVGDDDNGFPWGAAMNTAEALRQESRDPRALFPMLLTTVKQGRGTVWLMTSSDEGELVDEGPWCPACRRLGHAWCGVVR